MAVHSQAAHPDPAGDRGWSPALALSLFSLAMVLEIISISTYMTATGLKSIGEHFRTDQLAWVMTAWLLVGAVASPVMGKLADIHGKRKMFLSALAVATVGAALSALAPTFALFLVGRALFGFIVPCMFLAFSLMRDVYPPPTLALSVSVGAAGMGLMAVPSPFLAGWLLDTWSFRSLFWFFAIVLVAMAPLIVATTPESPVRTPGRVDVPGALMLGGGLALVLVSISFGPTWGWTEGGTLAYLLGGLALLAAWVAQSLRTSDPLIDLRFFKSGPMPRITAAAGFGYGAMTLYTTILPMMCMTPVALALGYGFGVDAKEFALLQAPIGVGSVLGGIAVGRAIRSVSPALTLVAGSSLMMVACVLTAFSHTDKALLTVWVLVFGTGMGMLTASIPNLVIATVPATVQASMAGMVQTSQSLISSVFPVVAFAVLNSHVATLIDGYAYYSGTGMTVTFLIAAGGCVLSVVAAASVLRRRAGTTTPVGVPSVGTDVAAHA